MAIIGKDNLTKGRNYCENLVHVNYTKAEINTAFQEVEDWFENNKSNLVQAVSGKFTLDQKKRIIEAYLIYKLNIGLN